MTEAQRLGLRRIETRGKPLLAAGQIIELGRGIASGGKRRLPGERELASELGVSRRTLQYALHLLAACGVIRSEHGRGNFFEPAGNWRDLPGPGDRLLLAAPWGSSRPGGEQYMFGEFAAGIEAAVGAASAELTCMTAAELSARLPEAGFSDGFSGVLMVDPPGGGLAARLLAASDWRVVAMEHEIRDLPVTSVADGSFLGTYEATGALLGLGHRRIAFIDRQDWQSANPVKSDGWLAAMEDAGLPGGRELFRTVPVPAEAGAVCAAMNDLAAADRPPTAVVCFSDDAAGRVLEWMEARGLTAGRELSVIGSGDRMYRRGQRGNLSSVRVHYRRMGEVAALEAVCGARGAHMRTVIVPNRLKLRASVGRAPG